MNPSDITRVRDEPERQGGRLYWLFRNTLGWIGGFMAGHKLATLFISLGFLACAYLFREEWQPLAVFTRRYGAPALLALAVFWLMYRMTRSSRWWKRYPLLLLALTAIGTAGYAYEYTALWVRFSALNVEYIDELPETGHERIPPLHGVHSLAQGNLGDSKNITRPSYVRIREKDGTENFYFTMGVEPAYPMEKIFGTVHELIATKGTTANLDLGPSSRREVHFAVGENLWLSSNDKTAAVRTLGPLRFFSYEPVSSRFLVDDAGEPVEIIMLLRWRGILFPYPEFGGVLVIREQKDSSLGKYLERVLFGEGTWIPPEKVKEYPYLAGQNIMPERVSDYIVESMRFMNGISLPLVLYHQGDVRVPKLPEDMNPMPYTTYFQPTRGMAGMLYHYYALEPYLEGKHGLVASVLIPADGTQRILVYQHEKKSEGLFGVSQVAGTVRSSRRTYNWQTSIPVEHRPYVRKVDGKNKLFYLTTIVTYKDERKKEFVGVPELVITNPANANGSPEWVDASAPEKWAEQLPK